MKKNYFLSKLILTQLLFLFVVYSNTTIKINAQQKDNKLVIWYKPNIPLGEGKGIFPGRVAWGHDSKIASWDGKTGYWWDDRYNDQAETDKLLTLTLCGVTGNQNIKKSWELLFTSFNKSNRNINAGYQRGEKLAIKINENNTYSHESNNEINANPQLILSLLKSLINEAGIPEQNITVADPSRFITDNIYKKCHTVFPEVHYTDHNGGEGREKSSFIENGFLYSNACEGMSSGLSTSFTEATYVINLAIMKGHVTQGVSLCAKNFFGCTSIETDWHKNSHCYGFSQSKEGKRQYSVYPDFMGHKNLGGKTMLFLIDAIYSNKFVNGVPDSRWTLQPFNNQWPGCLFASQDGVAVESVVLDFALALWPDAPDMLYSDFYLEEMALAGNPPSGTFYDPERTGKRLTSLGTTEHWNNWTDKKYSRNLGLNKGIELFPIEIK